MCTFFWFNFICSQMKFVAIILILLVFFMQFFAWPVFCLAHLTFILKNAINSLRWVGIKWLSSSLRAYWSLSMQFTKTVLRFSGCEGAVLSLNNLIPPQSPSNSQPPQDFHESHCVQSLVISVQLNHERVLWLVSDDLGKIELITSRIEKLRCNRYKKGRFLPNFVDFVGLWYKNCRLLSFLSVFNVGSVD